MKAPRYYTSVDGSTRCTGCSLHPDTCTCEPGAWSRLLQMMGFTVSSDADGGL